MLTHHRNNATQPSRVVLLGANGFLASHLRRRLDAGGASVLAIGSRDIDLAAPDAASALSGRLRAGDAVVFLAALTPDRGRGIDTLMSNLRMAEQVTSALSGTVPSHVVYISSDAVYRDTEPLVDENSPADSPSLYGTMHALRERMLLHAIGSSTPLALLRPTLIFGEGDTHNSYGPNRFMRAALTAGTVPLFGTGEEQRDHVFVDDVVRLIEAVLAHRSAGVLNLVTGQSIGFGDLARKVAMLAGGARLEHMPRSGGPILHRHYDTTALFRAFPEFRLTPRDEALAAAWKGLAARV